MAGQEEIDQQVELLNSYRRTLSHYLKRQALLVNANISPEIEHGIHEARDNIRRIKGILRSWDIPVDDHTDDESPVLSSNTLPNMTTDSGKQSMRTATICPNCGGWVRSGAKYCKHCRASISDGRWEIEVSGTNYNEVKEVLQAMVDKMTQSEEMAPPQKTETSLIARIIRFLKRY